MSIEEMLWNCNKYNEMTVLILQVFLYISVLYKKISWE